jgi:hypothetical protein
MKRLERGRYFFILMRKEAIFRFFFCFFVFFRRVCEQGDQMHLLTSRPKCSQKTCFLPKLLHNFYGGKKWPQNFYYFCNLLQTTQSKQSPNRRKFAQSDHPVVSCQLPLFCTNQGCQIFLGMYNIPKYKKNIPNYHKMYPMAFRYGYQMAVKYSTCKYSTCT